MAKLLKPMVVVLLVLSIASLVLGIMLFGQREEVKGRTQLLENTAMEIARGLHYDDLQRLHLLEYDTRMRNALGQLSTHAADTQQDLLDTRQDLENTLLDLEQTEEELRITQENLEASQRRVEQLEAQVEGLRSDVARLEREVSDLERARDSLQAQVDDLEIQVVQLEEEGLEKDDQIAELEDLVARYEAELYPDDDQIGTPEGLEGSILIVNADWNFVILDIGEEQGLSLNTEMLVHRDDNLVGRVRVINVKETFAIADILTSWTVVPLEEGDHVVF